MFGSKYEGETLSEEATENGGEQLQEQVIESAGEQPQEQAVENVEEQPQEQAVENVEEQPQEQATESVGEQLQEEAAENVGEQPRQQVSRRRSAGRERHENGELEPGQKKRKRGKFGTFILILLILLILSAIALVVLEWFSDSIPFLKGGAPETLEAAQQLADRCDYNGALAVLQGYGKYNSNTEMQEKAAEYEAANAVMLQDIEFTLESAEERIWEFDYLGGVDILKANRYYEFSSILQARAAEYEKAEETSGSTNRITVAEADRQAAMYDYDNAIAMLTAIENYEMNPSLQARVASYEAAKATCVPIDPKDITHIFYHSLVVDPSKAFNPEDEGYAGWQQWMTTVSEFDKITQSMYERGYVLVGIHDLITKTEKKNGKVKITPNQIMLPEGKKAYVLSLDDLSYYHTYDDHGVASKLVLDEQGKVTCEYIQADGSVVYGPYDAVPRLEAFLTEHPDACYHGARGIIALTGYDGIFGYRTDGAYSEKNNTKADTYYADELQLEWLAKHPDYNWEQECADAKAIADALKEEGWEFANHTWGHKAVGDATYESLVRDTERWMQYVSPLIGPTDAIIFAHGQDISSTGVYDSSNKKYTYLKSQGFDIFCNVDSQAYATNVTSQYLHQGRRNLDGYRIYQDLVSERPMAADLFDAEEVIDPERPLPVPDLGESSERLEKSEKTKESENEE